MRARISIFLGFCLALLITGCTSSPSVPAETRSALAVFPDDARMMGKVDLQALRTDAGVSFSAERGFTMRLMDSDFSYNPLGDSARAKLQEFMARTGINPETDVKAVYVAASESENDNYRFIVQADMEADQLQQYLDETLGDAFEIGSYNDLPVYRLAFDDADSRPHMAVVDDMVLAAPSETGLHTMIDRAQSGSTDEPSVLPLVAESVPNEGFWVVVRNLPTDQLMQEASDDESSFRRIAKVVRDMSASVSFANNQAHGRLLLTTDANADDVASVVRGAVAAMRTGTDLDEEQRALLDKVQVTAGDGQVIIDLKAEKEAVMRTMVGMMRPRA